MGDNELPKVVQLLDQQEDDTQRQALCELDDGQRVLIVQLRGQLTVWHVPADARTCKTAQKYLNGLTEGRRRQVALDWSELTEEAPASQSRPNRAAQEMLHARSIRQAAEFYEQGCSERSNQSRRSLWEPADREEEPYLHYWGNKWRVVGK